MLWPELGTVNRKLNNVLGLCTLFFTALLMVELSACFPHVCSSVERYNYRCCVLCLVYADFFVL